MKIYTKSGDKGFTTLTGGEKVAKNNPHVAAYGTVDEANSLIGLAITELETENFKPILKMLNQVQNDLFHVGAELSTPKGQNVYWPITEEHTRRIETFIDTLENDLPALQQFILPGGAKAGALLHVARTVIRRAEREAIILKEDLSTDFVLIYLNRCSDFLFVAARWVNQKTGKEEMPFHTPS